MGEGPKLANCRDRESGEAGVRLLRCPPVLFIDQHDIRRYASPLDDGCSAYLFRVDLDKIAASPVHRLPLLHYLLFQPHSGRHHSTGGFFRAVRLYWSQR